MDSKNEKKNLTPRNSSSSTPAHLLASVLEQRYAHKSKSKIKGKDEKPDPMTFPAMQKALGSVYSTLVDIVDDEPDTEEAEIAGETPEEGNVQSIENVQRMNEQLLSMVSEIEETEKKREEVNKAEVVEVQKRKADPYNRALNSYSKPPTEPDDIDLSDNLKIETIVSEKQEKRNRRFRNEA